jgi:calcineurin-like phosphoesterase family protein
MDECLINNINRYVKKHDTLYYLGDWVFPGKRNYTEVAQYYRDRIDCNNIIFIWGNHDNKGRTNTNCRCAWNKV